MEALEEVREIPKSRDKMLKRENKKEKTSEREKQNFFKVGSMRHHERVDLNELNEGKKI